MLTLPLGSSVLLTLVAVVNPVLSLAVSKDAVLITVLFFAALKPMVRMSFSAFAVPAK